MALGVSKESAVGEDLSRIYTYIYRPNVMSLQRRHIYRPVSELNTLSGIRPWSSTTRQ